MQSLDGGRFAANGINDEVRVEKIAHSLIPFGSNLPLPADWIFSDSQFAQLSLDCLPIGALGLRWSKQCDQHVCLGRQIFKFGAFDSPRFEFGFDGRVGFHGQSRILQIHSISRADVRSVTIPQARPSLPQKGAEITRTGEATRTGTPGKRQEGQGKAVVSCQLSVREHEA